MHKLKTAPAEEPVTLEEVRKQLGITNLGDNTRDDIITARIRAAREYAEEQTRRALVTQTWTLYADRFRYYFDLKAELQSVASVKYLDANGTQQTLAADQYLVDAISSRLYPAYGVTWPGIRAQANAVEIEYVSGYGLAAAVPQRIKEAIVFLVGHWENYQTQIEATGRIQTVPYAVEQLLSPFIDRRNTFS